MTRPERSRPAGRKDDVPEHYSVMFKSSTAPCRIVPSQVLVDGDRISLSGSQVNP